MTKSPVRVLLAEDQSMVRGAMAALLSMEDDIEVVAQVASGDLVVPEALGSLPDVAVLDVEMPGWMGCRRLRRCARHSPAVAC